MWWVTELLKWRKNCQKSSFEGESQGSVLRCKLSLKWRCERKLDVKIWRSGERPARNMTWESQVVKGMSRSWAWCNHLGTEVGQQSTESERDESGQRRRRISTKKEAKSTKKKWEKERKERNKSRRKHFMEKVEKYVQCSYKVKWHKHIACVV